MKHKLDTYSGKVFFRLQNYYPFQNRRRVGIFSGEPNGDLRFLPFERGDETVHIELFRRASVKFPTKILLFHRSKTHFFIKETISKSDFYSLSSFSGPS